MKVIDAYWEKRNLGVEALEIVINDNDNLDEITEVLKMSTEYIVVKTSSGRFDVHEKLSCSGYVYVESLINLKIDVKDAVLNQIQSRICPLISYDLATSQEINFIFKEIRKGVFVSDRIATDPFFSPSLSNERYIHWVEDELKLGAELFKISFKDNVIGFFTFKELNNGEFYPFLGGLLCSYNQTGLGFSVIRKPIEEVIKRNGNSISTFVSSNNLAIIRAHVQQGFNLNQIQNIFIKHN